MNGLYIQLSCLQNNSRVFCLLFTPLCKNENEIMKILNQIEIVEKKQQQCTQFSFQLYRVRFV